MATTTTTSAARLVANFLASGEQKIVLDFGDKAVSIEHDDDAIVVETTVLLDGEACTVDILAALGMRPTDPVEDRR